MKADKGDYQHDDNAELELMARVEESFPDYRAKGIGTWEDGYPKTQKTLGKQDPPIPNGTNAIGQSRGEG